MNKKKSNKSRYKTIFIFFGLMLLSVSFSFAQKQKDLSQKVEFSIKSKILGERRDISIYLPDKYDSASRIYPVIYVLDGRTHSPHTAEAVNFLSNFGIIPEMIVVSIHNVDRNRDFSPVYDERYPTSGGAEKFLGFVSDELMKYIDKKYRTSGFSILVGHSFGGTFATYSLLTKPEVFDAYIVISPYLHYDDNYLVNEAKNKLRSNYDKHKDFYMTVGNEKEYYQALEQFSLLINEKSNKFIDFEYVKMEDESHVTIPYISVFNGLKFIFSDLDFQKENIKQGLGFIDGYYKQLSLKYGIEIRTPENLLNLLGYYYLKKNDNKNAIKIFAENVKRNPISSNVYDSLGEAYERDNQLESAKINYQKAYDFGSVYNNPNTSVYLKNLNRVIRKL